MDARPCRFCSRYRRRAERSDEPWDAEVFRTDRFVVVPTKGPLVEGWLLVIPLDHRLSFSALDEVGELDELLSRTVELVAGAFAAPTLFEHGATTAGSAFGCGIDHAHLHVAPLKFSLERACRSVSPSTVWHDSAAPWIEPTTAPYLAIREPQATWRRACPAAASRQFFRQAIAAAVGLGTEFDYDVHPARELTAETARVLQVAVATP